MPELNESLDTAFTEHAKGRFCGITVSLRLNSSTVIAVFDSD